MSNAWKGKIRDTKKIEKIISCVLLYLQSKISGKIRFVNNYKKKKLMLYRILSKNHKIKGRIQSYIFFFSITFKFNSQNAKKYGILLPQIIPEFKY